MFVRIRLIKRKRLTPEKLNNQITKFVRRTHADLDVLGSEALSYMKSYLKRHIRREGNTGNLEDALTIEKTKYAIYIGNKEVLNAKAKYWYVLNCGATIKGEPFIPPINRGYFGEGKPPNARGREHWTHMPKQGGEAYLLRPTKFTPINYIGATNIWLSKNWRKILTKTLKNIR